MTGDQLALLAAIAADPADDTPRLVYADWLEEFGRGDRDAATLAFIRLSCGRLRKDRKPRKTMADDAACWLEANWRRLVPGLTAGWMAGDGEKEAAWLGDQWAEWQTRTRLKAGVPFRLPLRREPVMQADGTFAVGENTGNYGNIDLRNWPEVGRTTGDQQLYTCVVYLAFDRGFLWFARWRAPRLGPKLAGLVRADQPLAVQEGPGAMPALRPAQQEA